MNKQEAGQLLAWCAGRDGRQVDAWAVDAWTVDLADIGLGEARAAVTEHYRQSNDRVMPAHIRQRVRAARVGGRDDQRGSHCGRAGCTCTHTGGCEAGWLDNVAGTVQADLFDDDQEQRPALRVHYDSVRPCPTCRPGAAAVVDEYHGNRQQMGRKVRTRTDR